MICDESQVVFQKKSPEHIPKDSSPNGGETLGNNLPCFLCEKKSPNKKQMPFSRSHEKDRVPMKLEGFFIIRCFLSEKKGGSFRVKTSWGLCNLMSHTHVVHVDIYA